MGLVSRYMKWLHTGWPAGTVEKLPAVREDGSTNVPGLYIVGDLTGIPLLKFSSDTGARAVQTLCADPEFQGFRNEPGPDGRQALDLVIVGAGVSGVAAALQAKRQGLTFEILEATELFSTVVNFPRGKPIYTYPTDMVPAGDLQFEASVKEDLVDELLSQTMAAGVQPRFARAERVVRKGRFLEVVIPEEENLLARRVIVGIGRSGNFRKLGVPGEEKEKVYNRLHDPKDFCDRNVLVVGGGDSALETAIALAQCGSNVTLSYRQPEFSRPKPENVDKLYALVEDPAADVQVEEPTSERVTTSAGRFLGEHRKPGSIRLLRSSAVKRIDDTEVTIARSDRTDETIANEAAFVMLGREAPLEFFRRSGVQIRGEWTTKSKITFVAFLLFCAALYDWKSGGYLDKLGRSLGGFPYDLGSRLPDFDPHSLLGITAQSAQGPSFWYPLAYSLLIVVFGIRRIRRRRTPYVKVQTLTLMTIQVLPLFLLPEILLPWLGHHGWLPAWIADPLFPEVTYGHGREFWRAYGLILAWPLMVYNIFTDAPIWGWIILGSIQTFVIIPALIRFWGKGAYCGWICSCGALAETLGDGQRHKMPHGPKWNRLNMIGQGILGIAFLLLLLRIASWAWPETGWIRAFNAAAKDGTGVSGPLHLLSYKWTIDVLLAGVLGYGLYFWYSGRMWCRFACPLAALMHVYARFSRFRILADKKKCISCNVCTAVCHQGIDIMNFANKGLPMEDPECVRCSACVQSCPTGVLTFGQVDETGEAVRTDSLAASPVQMAEKSP
ncbi:MAG: NAD(P)-binding domain-containing protein [Candidatus Krumholzibacteriia bacterium]